MSSSDESGSKGIAGIEIIGFTFSPATLRTILTLEELGIEEYEFEKTPQIKTPEFIATKHPFGRIPVMFDDGFKVFESRVICRYLVNKYQGTKNSTILIPKDLQKATLVEQFLSVESLYFDQPSLTIVFEEYIAKRMMNSEPNTKKVKEAKENIEPVLDVYEKFLKGKDYLSGEYSLADLAHVPNIFFTVDKTNSGDIFINDKRPNLARWVKNISERPVWKRVLAKYNLI
nr:855_t:CDS:2 [Entrophospora candida]